MDRELMAMKERSEMAVRFVQMHQRLSKGPASVGDLAKLVGCRYTVARLWVNAMLEANAIEFVGFGTRKVSRTGTLPSLYRWKQ
jgi:hypothetical protein